MKNVLLIVTLLFTTMTFAQEKKGTQKASIQTSAECTSCKKLLEEKLNYTKGVKYAELNLDNMILEISFSSKKISLDKIKKIVSELGYDADDVKANKTAYDALPACCKAGGPRH